MSTEPLRCFNCESIIPNPSDAIGPLGFCSEACQAYDKLMEMDKGSPLTTRDIQRAVSYLRDAEISPFDPEDFIVGAMSTKKEKG